MRKHRSTALALAWLAGAVIVYVGAYGALRAHGVIRVREWYPPDEPRVEVDGDSRLVRAAFWPLWQLESWVRPGKPYIGTRF